MSNKFVAQVARPENTASLVKEVFATQCFIGTERTKVGETGNVSTPAGHIGLIGDYRGFTLDSSQGRKSRLAGQTVVDLSSVSKIALADVPNLIEELQGFLNECEAGNVEEMLVNLAEQAVADEVAAAEAAAAAEADAE
jgi:hypothetical protein